MHLFHNWSKWTDMQSGSIYITTIDMEPDKKIIKGKYIYQERICSICNMKQLRTARTEI